MNATDARTTTAGKYFGIFCAAAIAALAIVNHRVLFDEAASLRKLGLIGFLDVQRQAIWDWNPLRCFNPRHSQDSFLFYCHTTTFNDYEHGAYYFQLESEAVANLRVSDVVFIGNSRLQHAFSTDVIDRFAERDGYKYHLLGMGYIETSEFFRRLFNRLDLRPKVLVINADPFFDKQLSVPAASVLREAWYTQFAYAWKKWLQGKLPDICGSSHTSLCEPPLDIGYRPQANGEWIWRGLYFRLTDNTVPIPENYGLSMSPQQEAQGLAIARSFLEEIRMSPHCVIVTSIPSEFATPHFARLVARELGATIIEPSAKGLATLEKSHLRYESAEVWSAAFLEQAAAKIKECVSSQQVPGAR